MSLAIRLPCSRLTSISEKRTMDRRHSCAESSFVPCLKKADSSIHKMPLFWHRVASLSFMCVQGDSLKSGSDVHSVEFQIGRRKWGDARVYVCMLAFRFARFWGGKSGGNSRRLRLGEGEITAFFISLRCVRGKVSWKFQRHKIDFLREQKMLLHRRLAGVGGAIKIPNEFSIIAIHGKTTLGECATRGLPRLRQRMRTRIVLALCSLYFYEFKFSDHRCAIAVKFWNIV